MGLLAKTHALVLPLLWKLQCFQSLVQSMFWRTRPGRRENEQLAHTCHAHTKVNRKLFSQIKRAIHIGGKHTYALAQAQPPDPSAPSQRGLCLKLCTSSADTVRIGFLRSTADRQEPPPAQNRFEIFHRGAVGDGQWCEIPGLSGSVCKSPGLYLAPGTAVPALGRSLQRRRK